MLLQCQLVSGVAPAGAFLAFCFIFKGRFLDGPARLHEVYHRGGGLGMVSILASPAQDQMRCEPGLRRDLLLF